MRWPAADVDVDGALARALLRAQHPDLADRPLRVAASGWDNVVCRLGDDLAVRLPRRAAAAQLIEHEVRWLPGLAERLPVPVAAPVRAGTPCDDPPYPFPWSVCRWIDGVTALDAGPPPADDLVPFLAALHRPAPPDAPINPVRGIPLAERHDRVLAHLDAVGDAVDRVALRRLWDELRELPPWPGPPCWLHGDLHLGNLVVDGRGRLAGVIDFGDLCAGDPATDLAVAWMLADPAGPSRSPLRADHDDATWGRARGWALTLAAVLAEN